MSDQNPPQYPSYPADDSSNPAPGHNPPPAYGQPVGQPGQTIAYASWWSRVGASLLDGLLTIAVVLVPVIVGAAIAFTGSQEDPITGELTGVNPLGVIIMVLGYLLVFAFAIWNQGIRMGRTGQSLGKKWVGIQVVHAETGQFLGGGMGFVRLLMASVLGNLCFINYLWPLWDERKQTWHDKIASSVVIRK